MIIVCAISLLISTTKAAQISPFSSNLYAPANMYRSTYSASLSGTTNAFSVNYPASPWAVAPQVLYSITGMSFSNRLTFQLIIVSKSLTAFNVQITFDNTLKSVSFCFLAMDTTLYSVSLSFFDYVMSPGTSGPQQFIVTNNEQHAASFLVGLKLIQGPYPSGFAPSIGSQVVLGQANIVTTSLTVDYDPLQMAVQKMRILFIDFNISSFRPPEYAGSGQKFAIFGTSGTANDPYMTSTYFSSYSSSYFFGILALYDGQFLSASLSVDAINALSTNIYYFNSQLLFVAYRCSSSYPITDVNRQFCYSDCASGFYWDGQYMCQPCDSNCLTCSMNATNCTSCQSPWILSYGYVCKCSGDSYQQISGNGSVSCILCSSIITGCYSCNRSVCWSCMNNMQLVQGSSCVCGQNKTAVTIDSLTYCIETLYSFAEECESGYNQDEQICLCDSYFSASLNGGICT